MNFSLDKRGRLKLHEKDVTRQAIAFLRAEGWLCLRLESELMTGAGGRFKRVGETGMADWLCLRAIAGMPAAMHGFFLELKAPGGRVRPSQKLWLEGVARDGYAYTICDSLDGLMAFLEENNWLTR